MSELGQDEAAISAVIDRFYSATLNPALWPSAFESFAMVTGGIGALLLSPSRPEPNLTYVSPSMAEPMVPYARHWHQVGPRREAGLSPALSDRCWSDEDVFSPDQLKRSAFHQEFLRAYDLGSQMTLTSLQLVPGSTFYLASQRSQSAGAPTPAERRAMEVLSSHAVRALQVYRSLAQPVLMPELLADVLAHLPTGIIVTDVHGRVVFMNRYAEALDGDGFCIDRGHILASAPRDRPTLARLIADTVAPEAKTADVRPIVLQRPSRKKPLVARSIPISARTDRPLSQILLGLDLVLLTINDPENETTDIPIDALKAYGLTESEAAIAAMLGTGASPREISETRSISIATVRTHIRRIYSKLDITRQGELAKIVSAVKRAI